MFSFNDLTVFIYVLHVIDMLRSGLIILAICVPIILGAITFVCAMNYDDARIGTDSENFWHEHRNKYVKRLLRWTPVIWAVVALFLIVIPPKETMYAMAASEVGGKIAQSEVGQDVYRELLDALRSWTKKLKE